MILQNTSILGIHVISAPTKGKVTTPILQSFHMARLQRSFELWAIDKKPTTVQWYWFFTFAYSCLVSTIVCSVLSLLSPISSFTTSMPYRAIRICISNQQASCPMTYVDGWDTSIRVREVLL